MGKKAMASDRVKHMDDQTLNDYIATLEQDLEVKQIKATRLAKDIQRHENILQAAEQERAQRGVPTGAYRGRQFPVAGNP